MGTSPAQGPLLAITVCGVLLSGAAAALTPVALTVPEHPCASREALVDAVTEKLGPNAFDDDAFRAVAVSFDDDRPSTPALDVPGNDAHASTVDDLLWVRIEVWEGERWAGQRRVGPVRGCAAAVDLAAFALALLLSPLEDPAGPRSPSPDGAASLPMQPIAPERPSPPMSPATQPTVTTTTTATATATTTTTTTATTTIPRPARKLRQGLTVGGGGGVGVGGGLALGVGPTALARAWLDVGQVPVGIGLVGRVELPQPLVLTGNKRLESVGLSVSVEGCWLRLGRWGDVTADVCGLFEVGGLRTTTVGFRIPEPVTAQIMAVGGALQLHGRLWQGLGVFARLTAASPVLRAELVSEGQSLWSSPPVMGSLVVGMEGAAPP